jgi:two-component system alkaline phosphatase synthesis response regulator PhoP
MQRLQSVLDILESHQFSCEFVIPDAYLDEEIVDKAPDIIIVDTDSRERTEEIIGTVRGFRNERPIPILVCLSPEMLDQKELLLGVDDFVVVPCNEQEILVRIDRVVANHFGLEDDSIIRCGELRIDLSRRDVTVGGRRVSLTFKEYELARFLASHRGRVFTRETLLNKIWGYDYFGGDRTVDVHIRRLRAKIEGGRFSFIETVRGIGYRFIDD